MCAVNPAKIEVENEPGNEVLMIHRSFAKIHRQARVTVVKRPQARVDAFDMAGADLGAVIQVQ